MRFSRLPVISIQFSGSWWLSLVSMSLQWVAITAVALTFLIIPAIGGLWFFRRKRQKKKEDNAITKYWTRFKGYEIGAMLYQSIPYLEEDMNPILHQIIFKGLMRYNVIDWRQKFLKEPQDRIEYFAERYPYNKMTFYSNTYYMKQPANFDRLYKKLKKMIGDKQAEMEGKEVIPINIPAKLEKFKYPAELNNIHLMIFGQGKNPTVYTDGDRTITIKQNTGMEHTQEFLKTLKKWNDMPTRPPRVNGIGFSSLLVTVTLTDKKKKEKVEYDYLELTEIRVDAPLTGNFVAAMRIPWMHLIYLANRYKIPILIEGNEYFLAINMMLTTLNIILNPSWRENSEDGNLMELGEGIYKRFKDLYNPKTDPIEAWLLWIYAVSEYYHNNLTMQDKDKDGVEIRAYDVKTYGSTDVAAMEMARGERLKEKHPTINWNKTQYIPPLKSEFIETIRTEIDEPRGDLKYGAEYAETDENVPKMLKKNPNKGKVMIPMVPERAKYNILDRADSEERRKKWKEEDEEHEDSKPTKSTTKETGTGTDVE